MNSGLWKRVTLFLGLGFGWALSSPAFAAPSTSAALGAKEPSRKAWLGVELTAHDRTVVAKRVMRKSPAADAGVRDGDELLRIDDIELGDPQQLIARVALVGPESSVKLRLRRSGNERDVSIKLASFPGPDEVLRLDRVGSSAPEFDGLSPVGTMRPATHDLKDLRGQVVLVDFWATWCGPCRLMARQLSKWQEQYGAQGLHIVGITTETGDVAEKGARAMNMTYSVASDVNEATSLAYGVRAMPTMFVIDKRGRVREVLVGYDPAHNALLEKLIVELLREPSGGKAQ